MAIGLLALCFIFGAPTTRSAMSVQHDVTKLMRGIASAVLRSLQRIQKNEWAIAAPE